MGDDSELASTQQDLADVSADLAALQTERLTEARRRMRLSAQELLRAALIVEDLDDASGGSELELALETVRTVATDADLH
ncbi:hypothetical protein [Solicola sp. PLA-1-18]|uniref:hypothetical protein n=1 Tax=Solicola sp. PLA-1-18 TaxID=3380532 RepID=UPI003B7E2B29